MVSNINVVALCGITKSFPQIGKTNTFFGKLLNVVVLKEKKKKKKEFKLSLLLFNFLYQIWYVLEI